LDFELWTLIFAIVKFKVEIAKYEVRSWLLRSSQNCVLGCGSEEGPTLNFELWTSNFGRCVLGAATLEADRLWTLDFELWTLDFELWNLDFGIWILNFGL
jgi:hypothetical protein